MCVCVCEWRRLAQATKFKGLQRLVAEFVVEKNNEMEQLKRAVADIQVHRCAHARALTMLAARDKLLA